MQLMYHTWHYLTTWRITHFDSWWSILLHRPRPSTSLTRGGVALSRISCTYCSTVEGVESVPLSPAGPHQSHHSLLYIVCACVAVLSSLFGGIAFYRPGLVMSTSHCAISSLSPRNLIIRTCISPSSSSCQASTLDHTLVPCWTHSQAIR